MTKTVPNPHFQALPALNKELYLLLKDWFLKNKRDFPWRRTKDPYAIWVSEIMLQQTRASTVVPYYEAFLKQFPTVESLALASEEALLKAWEGLGYYRRAKNLQKGALYFLKEHQGKLPADYEALKKAHGIGEYTAGAIASFAFDLPVPAIDGNAVRVLSRLLGKPFSLSKEADRKKCAGYVQALFDKHPEISPALWNEALIELGATVCTPTQANYALHPWKEFDFAYQTGRLAEFPLPKTKKVLPEEHYLVFCLQDKDQKFYVQKRNKDGLLAGLWEFPMFCKKNFFQEDLKVPTFTTEKELFLRLFQEHKNCSPLPLPLDTENIRFLASKKHIFSHKIWHLQFFLIKIEESKSFFHTLLKKYEVSSKADAKDWLSSQDIKKLAFSSSQTALRDTLCATEI